VACYFEALTDTYLLPQCQRPESLAGDFMQQLAWLVRCQMLIGVMFCLFCFAVVGIHMFVFAVSVVFVQFG